MGVAIYSYRFTATGNFTGPVDLTVTTVLPSTNTTGLGLGFAVASVAGDVGGASITGEVGSGGTVATDPMLIKTLATKAA